VDLIIFRILQGVKCKAVIFFLMTQRRPAMDRSSRPTAVPAARATRRPEKTWNRTRRTRGPHGALTGGGREENRPVIEVNGAGEILLRLGFSRAAAQGSARLATGAAAAR
jgi:hypothetical protein